MSIQIFDSVRPARIPSDPEATLSRTSSFGTDVSRRPQPRRLRAVCHATPAPGGRDRLPHRGRATRRRRCIRRSEEHTSELQSHVNLVCRLLLEKKKKQTRSTKFEKKKKNK